MACTVNQEKEFAFSNSNLFASFEHGIVWDRRQMLISYKHNPSKHKMLFLIYSGEKNAIQSYLALFEKRQFHFVLK